jgi:predicted nucleic acid-binding Zn ribbon protein
VSGVQGTPRVNNDMKPVSTVVPAAIVHMLERQPLSQAKVSFAWHWAVGPAVDRATTISLREGVLQVRATDVHWRREIERSTHLILARLDAMLGAGIVKALKVDVCANR